MWQSILKTGGAVMLYAVVHSVLASHAAKGAAVKLLGERFRNAFYRPFYILQSLVTFGLLFWYLRRLPDRTLYELRGPFARLMRLGQLAALPYAVYSAHQVGIPGMLGLKGFLSWLTGEGDVPPEPEAQGPALSENRRMQVSGPFNASRHPLNFVPLPVCWLNPKMTLQSLVFNIVSTVYLVLGSIHEEKRLRAAYGRPYEIYQQSGIPFYVPFVGTTISWRRKRTG